MRWSRGSGGHINLLRRAPAGLAFAALAWAHSSAAVAQTHEIGGLASLSDPRNLLLLGVFAGLIFFSVFAAVSAYRTARKAKDLETHAVSELGRLRQRLESAESLLVAEPQALVVWSSDQDPRVATHTLDTSLGVPMEADAMFRFAEWLDGDSTADLGQAVNRLQADGQAFNVILRTRGGFYVEADGRAAAGRLVLKVRDITGRREELARICEQQRRFGHEVTLLKGLIDALPMPIWVRDAKGGLTWVNGAYARAVGAGTVTEVVQDSIELLQPHQRQRVEAALARKSVFHEPLDVAVDGETVVREVIALPLGGDSAGILLDHAAVDGAGEDGSQSASVLDRVPNAVAVFGADMRLLHYNSAYCELWELDRDWLDSGPREGDVLDALRHRAMLPEQADYRAWKTKHLSAYSAARSTPGADGARRIWPEETWHLPNGRSIRVAADLQSGGGVAYVFEDVTDQIALKTRLNELVTVQRETLDHLHEGVAVFAPDGRLQLFNPAYAAIWKLSTRELIRNPHIDDVVDQCRVLLDDDSAWREAQGVVTGFAENREPSAGRLNRPDGSVIDYAVVPLPDGATLLTYVDVTDSTRIERALRERNEALEAANALKTNFVRHVSYQLRTLLNTIIGYSDLIGRPVSGPLTEKQREYLGHVQSSGDGLVAIIDDILDLASIDAGSMELRLEPLQAGSVISQAALGVRERLAERDLKIKVHVDEDVGQFVADAKRVTQVLYNLLSNAVSFSPPSGDILVDCRRLSQDIVFRVMDQGRGISEERQRSIFERFESDAQGTSHRGVGLGLSIVKSLVELHGGRVDLQSKLGRGTIVTCRFPADPTGPGGLHVGGPPSDIGAPPLSETTSEQLDDRNVAVSAIVADKERARSA